MPDDEPEMKMPAWPQPDTPWFWPGDHVQRNTQPVAIPKGPTSIRLDISRPDKWYDLPTDYCMALWRESLEKDADGRSMPPEWSEERKARRRRWARLELGLEIDETEWSSGYPGMPSVPPFKPGVVEHIRFSKGELVPGWLEWSVIPGVFDVDADCVFGSIERLREMYPSTFLPKAGPDEPDRFSSYMAPVEPLRPGEGLIRYRGADPLVKVDRGLRADLSFCRVGFRTGGPTSVSWQRDGDDLLFMAHWADKGERARALGPALPGQPDEPVVPPGTIHEMRFARGDWVPNWLSDRMLKSGVFGVDATCLVGSREALLARHPGLFDPGRIRKDYEGDISCLSPADPLEPGDHLIRYLGGRELPATHNWLCIFVGGGGPEAVDWLEDGKDWLRIARPLLKALETAEAQEILEAPPPPGRLWRWFGLGKA